jgi:hypothetical protein
MPMVCTTLKRVKGNTYSILSGIYHPELSVIRGVPQESEYMSGLMEWVNEVIDFAVQVRRNVRVGAGCF